MDSIYFLKEMVVSFGLNLSRSKLYTFFLDPTRGYLRFWLEIYIIIANCTI